MQKPTISLAKLVTERLMETLQSGSAHLSEASAAGALARGHALEISGYFKLAADSYEEALAFDHGSEEATARLALALLKDGSEAYKEKALNTAMVLTARNPAFKLQELTSHESVGAMTILGDALLANGRADNAQEAYRAARKNNKDDTFAAGRLTQMALASGEPKKALEYAKDLGSNARFQEISSVLALGQTSEALLPVFRRDSLMSIVGRSDPGRPMIINGSPRFATLLEGDGSWCL